jgi:hypothetical protein
MRCKACDSILKEEDTVRKDIKGEYIDLCIVCFRISQSVLEDKYIDYQLDINLRKEGFEDDY